MFAEIGLALTVGFITGAGLVLFLGYRSVREKRHGKAD
jgi:hypothetical protein